MARPLGYDAFAKRCLDACPTLILESWGMAHLPSWGGIVISQTPYRSFVNG